MYILGINESETATAAILKDGKVIACVSEERFTRKKGQAGLPTRSIAFCLTYAGIGIAEVDLVVFGAKSSSAAIWYRTSKDRNVATLQTTIDKVSDIFVFLYNVFPLSVSIYAFICNLGYSFYSVVKPIITFFHHRSLAKALGVPRNRIYFLDHHTAHAYACYSVMDKKKTSLVITNDGAGDAVCGKVFVVEDDVWYEKARTPNRFSLGYLYYYVTQLLGFTPNREEYKVMGLSGYASEAQIDIVYPFFKDLLRNDGLSFRSRLPRVLYFIYLKSTLTLRRFDSIAGALQRLTETLLVGQVRIAIKKLSVKDIVLGGGVFQNVKANMQIAKIASVSSLSICPSPSDESVAIGACFWGYQKYAKEHNEPFQPHPFPHLFLGPTFTSTDVEQTIQTAKKSAKSTFSVKRITKKRIPSLIAKLLVEGHIIARFSGRMEFGARALGNRSILANPRDVRTIRIINEQIKGRDFWMPFAPTILAKRSLDYLVNPKKLGSPSMMLGFETTPLGRKDISAAVHPYDFTTRPQILVQKENPDYYAIIEEFEKLTGVGAVLNTSFNLHGEPIVCTPHDAISTFQRSGLTHLLIEDFLLVKN